MLDAKERQYLYLHACIPEQVPEYVNAISGAEPFLLNDHLCYLGTGTVVLVGYPLQVPFDRSRLKEQLDIVSQRFRPDCISLIAPLVPRWTKPAATHTSDHYYRLAIDRFEFNQKLLYMLKRASRETSVQIGNELGEEHVQCIAEFLDSPKIDVAYREIFTRIPVYVSMVPTSRVFTARNNSGILVAFTIAEFGARDYGFYMFNFRSRSNYVPGASDLLIHQVLVMAKDMGKAYINFGLGIHQGVEFFKKKWGAYPFLNYEHCLYQTARTSALKSLLFNWQF